MLVRVDTKWRDLHIFSARSATEIPLVSNVGTTSQRNGFLDCVLKHLEQPPIATEILTLSTLPLDGTSSSELHQSLRHYHTQPAIDEIQPSDFATSRPVIAFENIHAKAAGMYQRSYHAATIGPRTERNLVCPARHAISVRAISVAISNYYA
jgi:hypothetical protein